MATSVLDKISHLSLGAAFDLTCAEDQSNPHEFNAITSTLKRGRLEGESEMTLKTSGGIRFPGVSHVISCGRRMPVLRVMQTSHCQFNCKYCAFRKGIDCRREEIDPAELAFTTNEMIRAGVVEGLFLTSGIGGSIRNTMTRMIDTARILREKHLYTGYIHMKILPGATDDLIENAGFYADRLSVNMEAPSESALKAIAPNKGIKANILSQMQTIETLRRIGKIPGRVGQVTQFVVGGSDDPGASDRALITASEYLYRELNFRRIFYSAFNPVPGTPLEGRTPENPKRSFRLYQADRLIALYGYKPDDFSFSEEGRMYLDTDPKVAWANAHPEKFPIDVCRADPTELLRIPGIGPVTVKRILQARFEGRMKTVDDLRGLVRLNRIALDWVLVNGHAPEMKKKRDRRNETQLALPL